MCLRKKTKGKSFSELYLASLMLLDSSMIKSLLEEQRSAVLEVWFTDSVGQGKISLESESKHWETLKAF